VNLTGEDTEKTYTHYTFPHAVGFHSWANGWPLQLTHANTLNLCFLSKGYNRLILNLNFIFVWAPN